MRTTQKFIDLVKINLCKLTGPDPEKQTNILAPEPVEGLGRGDVS